MIHDSAEFLYEKIALHVFCYAHINQFLGIYRWGIMISLFIQRGKILFDIFLNMQNTFFLLITGCSAKSFWLLARHGSRNPGEDDISLMEIKAPEIQTAILDNYENGKGNITYNSILCCFQCIFF